MKHNYYLPLLSILLLYTSFAVAQSPGDIVITEVMGNPAATSDAMGEWFELYNPTSSPIDINGWHIKDNGSGDITINNQGPLIIQPADFIVLITNSDPVINGGIVADYTYSGLGFSNVSESVVIATAGGLTIDSVAYTSTNPGISWSLDPAFMNSSDNDNFTYWCSSTSVYGSGDMGTPGMANDPCGITGISGLTSSVNFFVSNADDKLLIHISPPVKKQNWEIVDIAGRVVLSGVLGENTESTTLFLNEMTSGIYIFCLKESSMQSKFIIK